MASDDDRRKSQSLKPILISGFWHQDLAETSPGFLFSLIFYLAVGLSYLPAFAVFLVLPGALWHRTFYGAKLAQPSLEIFFELNQYFGRVSLDRRNDLVVTPLYFSYYLRPLFEHVIFSCLNHVTDQLLNISYVRNSVGHVNGFSFPGESPA